jgi:hypothetical protein
MSRGRRSNRKGRSVGAGPFVMLPNYVFDSAAFQSLKPGPKALLFELIRQHNGSNNGRIIFSARQMAEALNVSDRETIAKYTRELVNTGLICPIRLGGFNVKASERRATEWALTWIAVGTEPPSKDFLKWQPAESDGPEKPASTGGKPVRRKLEASVIATNVLLFPPRKRSS